MIIVSGSLTVDPARRDAFVAGCRPVVEQARAAPGCLDFAITTDTVDPARVVVYERWESGAAVEAFRLAGSPATPQAELLDAAVARYEVASVGPA